MGAWGDLDAGGRKDDGLVGQAQLCPDDVPDFGDLLAQVRAHHGLTQRRLADRAGVAESSIKNWESGRAIPRAIHLATLGRVLGVRFILDAAGRYAILDTAVAPAGKPPRVVILILDTAEAVHAAFEELGITRD